MPSDSTDTAPNGDQDRITTTAAGEWPDEDHPRCTEHDLRFGFRCDKAVGHKLPHVAFTAHSTAAWGIGRGEIREG